ncbi:hypothetical protein OXT66_05515 [Lentilactobacillus senioris]|uniref:hypothetical protein n=1 Tax=Lentilactobacillus senioris TaxID=931534 RepID=UPI002280EEB5|nr:hypothetical protein [Lentilactobacillus senioris]MCY9807008.1 hypothetical protein [Lentilactobacillus senioris]
MNSDFVYHKHAGQFCIMAKGNLAEDVVLLQVGYGEQHLHYIMSFNEWKKVQKVLQ